MTIERFKPLLDRDFLKGDLWYQYIDYQNDGHDERLKKRFDVVHGAAKLPAAYGKAIEGRRERLEISWDRKLGKA